MDMLDLRSSNATNALRCKVDKLFMCKSALERISVVETAFSAHLT